MSFLIAIIAGCSGTVRQELFSPEAPEGAMDVFMSIDLQDAEIKILPVVTSTKLEVLYGPFFVLPTPHEEEIVEEPLEIVLWLEVRRGKLSVNFEEITITLTSNGRILQPVEILEPVTEDIPGGRSKTTYKKHKGEITVSAQKDVYVVNLIFEMDRASLELFTLNLPPFELNGQTVNIQPIKFVRSSRRQSG